MNWYYVEKEMERAHIRMFDRKLVRSLGHPRKRRKITEMLDWQGDDKTKGWKTLLSLCFFNISKIWTLVLNFFIWIMFLIGYWKIQTIKELVKYFDKARNRR